MTRMSRRVCELRVWFRREYNAKKSHETNMTLRRLWLSAGIVAVGLAMIASLAGLPTGNHDNSLACLVVGVALIGFGLLHPFKLGWLGALLSVIGLFVLVEILFVVLS